MSEVAMAGLLAGLAAASLPLGALLAMVFRPSARTVAMVMAFGSGALIHAVVTELATRPATSLVGEHGADPRWAWAVIAAGFSIGGLFYVAVNAVVERHGGGVHRPNRLRERALQEKQSRASPVLQALAGTEIAQRLAPEEAEAVLPFLRVVECCPGDVVYRAGDPSDALYVVQHGRFESRRASTSPGDGAPSSVILSPGDVVGGLSLLEEEARATTLTAVDRGILLALSRADFDRALATLPSLKSTVADMVVRQLFESARDRSRVDPAEWYRTAVRSLQYVTRAEEASTVARAAGSSSPFAIFVGTLQDGVPESLAIGASFTSLAAFNPTFLVAVLLSNLPEALSGTSALLQGGLSRTRICLMWLGLVLGSTVAGALGCALLYRASPEVVAWLGAFAGGGVVAMLAMTMMPEAYEEGHASVVPATIAGFLASLLLSILELGAS